MAGELITAAAWLLFIGWLCWHAFAEVRDEWESRRPGSRANDRAIAASLYPSTGRGTVATPTTAPRRTA